MDDDEVYLVSSLASVEASDKKHSQDMSRPLYSGCEQDTVACEHT